MKDAGCAAERTIVSPSASFGLPRLPRVRQMAQGEVVFLQMVVVLQMAVELMVVVRLPNLVPIKLHPMQPLEEKLVLLQPQKQVEHLASMKCQRQVVMEKALGGIPSLK